MIHCRQLAPFVATRGTLTRKSLCFGKCIERKQSLQRISMLSRPLVTGSRSQVKPHVRANDVRWNSAAGHVHLAKPCHPAYLPLLCRSPVPPHRP
jgi:hypothetical protein